MAEEHDRPARLLEKATGRKWAHNRGATQLIWVAAGESVCRNKLVIRNSHAPFMVHRTAMLVKTLVGPGTRLYAEAAAMQAYTVWADGRSPHAMRAHLVGVRRKWHRQNPRRAL